MIAIQRSLPDHRTAASPFPALVLERFRAPVRARVPGFVLALVLGSCLGFLALPGSAAAADEGWTQCGQEGTVCTFPGSREVRYGASPTEPGRYAAKVFDSRADCSNATFGDPAPKVAKRCWVAATESRSTAMKSSAAASPPPSRITGRVPTPESIKGLPVVGPIDATDGQVIEKVHVVNPSGPCIVIKGKRDVVIRDSEIGPCGHETNSVEHSGIRILAGSTNITIDRNVLHDAPALISVNAAVHPIYIRRNLFYNVRGTSWAFQAIGVGETRLATGSTQILCNVMDDTLMEKYPMAGGRERHVEDHINFYNSGGTARYPVEIAYNRIRGLADGKGGQSGTGMQLGDSAAGGGGKGSNVPGYFYVHDNIVSMVNGQGIAIAGGVGSVVKDNMVDNRGTSQASMTGWPYGLRNFDRDQPASVTYSGNKGIANLWAHDRDGHRAPPLNKIWHRSGFDVTDGGGNDFQYDFKTDIWNEPLNAACQ